MLCACLLLFAHPALAVVVYQTVQDNDAETTLDGSYHTFITQVSGNASQNFGDEIRLDSNTAGNRVLTSIVVPTQTF